MPFAGVDAQGFTGRKGEFVVKEIAFANNSDNKVEKFYLKPPYAYGTLPQYRRKSISIVRERVNGLNWDDGILQYEAGLKSIQDYASRTTMYYCKGEEKAKALSELFRINVYNIEKFMEETDYHSYFVYQDEHLVNCKLHSASEDAFLKCAVKTAYSIRTLMRDFFKPLSCRYTISYLDMQHTDCRLESFRMVRSTLATSPIVGYLARIGYFFKADIIICHYCGVNCGIWQSDGEVQMLNIPHFHQRCPNAPPEP